MSKKWTEKGFLINMNDQYNHLNIEVFICEDENSFHNMVDLFHSMMNPPRKRNDLTEAIFLEFTDSWKPIPNPIGLIILQKGYTLGVLCHEMFHATRYYFKLIDKRINNKKDETFAYILGDLIDKFVESAMYLSTLDPTPLEQNGISPSSAQGDNNG